MVLYIAEMVSFLLWRSKQTEPLSIIVANAVLILTF